MLPPPGLSPVSGEPVVAKFDGGLLPSDGGVVVLPELNSKIGLYEEVYCRRGQAENHVKSWKTHLAADRPSCAKATANQFRLFLRVGAYWLL